MQNAFFNSRSLSRIRERCDSFIRSFPAVLKLLKILTWSMYSFILASVLLTLIFLFLTILSGDLKEKQAPNNLFFFAISLASLAFSFWVLWWILKKLPPDSPFSDVEKRTLGVLAGIMGCGTFIVLIGGFDLSLSMLRFPDVGFGRGVIEITGSNRLDGVSRFKYLYYFCLWFGLLSPLIICPAAILLRKRKVFLLSLLCLLPIFSYFEVNTGIQAGFHYHAQLRERFGKEKNGYLAIDRLMPPDIRKEYDRSPRKKSCMVAAVSGWLCWPLWNLFCFPVIFLITSGLSLLKRKTEKAFSA